MFDREIRRVCERTWHVVDASSVCPSFFSHPCNLKQVCAPLRASIPSSVKRGSCLRSLDSMRQRVGTLPDTQRLSSSGSSLLLSSHSPPPGSQGAPLCQWGWQCPIGGECYVDECDARALVGIAVPRNCRRDSVSKHFRREQTEYKDQRAQGVLEPISHLGLVSSSLMVQAGVVGFLGRKGDPCCLLAPRRASWRSALSKAMELSLFTQV